MSSRIARPASEVPAQVVVPTQRAVPPVVEDDQDEAIENACPGCGGPVLDLIGGSRCDSDESCGWYEIDRDER